MPALHSEGLGECGSTSAFSLCDLYTPEAGAQTLFIRSKEEPKIGQGQSQAGADLCRSLTYPCPHPSPLCDEVNPCYGLRPGSSPQVLSSGSHCGLQKWGPQCWAKVRVTFKPSCVSLANLFPTLSLHAPSVGYKGQCHRGKPQANMGNALVTAVDMEESNLDTVGRGQSWMLKRRKVNGGVSQLTGRETHLTGKYFPVLRQCSYCWPLPNPSPKHSRSFFLKSGHHPQVTDPDVLDQYSVGGWSGTEAV